MFLTEVTSLSRSLAQKLIKDNCVKVNQSQIKSNFKLKTGDTLQVTFPEIRELEVLPEKIELDILYEDKDLIILNKKQGVVVHPAAGHYTGTLVNGLIYHCGDELSGINGVMRPGIVHRIDKDTSGVLVVAKNDYSHKHLSAQLSEHNMTRKYEAIVLNNIKDDKGTIDKPIGRHQVERKKMCVTNRNSKRAVTHFEVKERFGKYTFIELMLETGRTHQIRVHMSSIGHSVLGDKVYGSESAGAKFKLNGQALHAKILGFIHPTKNEYMEFISPTPSHMSTVLKILRGREN